MNSENYATAMARQAAIAGGKLTISTTGSAVTVDVLAALGGLAVHQNINREAAAGVWKYALSHASSGLRLACFRSRGEAVAAMRAVAPLLPWRASGSALLSAASQKMRLKAWGLIRKCGGWREDGGWATTKQEARR